MRPCSLGALAAGLLPALLLAQLGNLVQPARFETLGSWPLCEASAAARDPSSPRRVWIADNERSDLLFAFELGPHGLGSMRQVEIPGGEGIRDVEALVASAGDLLLVASHSLDKRCEFRPKRWQLRWLRAEAGRLREVGALDSSAQHVRIASGPAGCVGALFGASAPAGARAFCEVLARSEANVAPARCQALDIEGAAALPAAPDGRDSEPRIWLGMRSPRVAGRAILVRLAQDSTSLRFDGIASIDLGGRGIRELAYANGTLWGIAGPVSDAREHFTLWGIPAASLVPGAMLAEPTTQRPLPPAAEGLVIDGDRAIVFTDGVSRRDGSETCEVGSSQTVIALPAISSSS